MNGQGSTGNVIAAICSFFAPGLGNSFRGDYSLRLSTSYLLLLCGLSGWGGSSICGLFSMPHDSNQHSAEIFIHIFDRHPDDSREQWIFRRLGNLIPDQCRSGAVEGAERISVVADLVIRGADCDIPDRHPAERIAALIFRSLGEYQKCKPSQSIGIAGIFEMKGFVFENPGTESPGRSCRPLADRSNSMPIPPIELSGSISHVHTQIFLVPTLPLYGRIQLKIHMTLH